ncbi:Fc.00g041600.m01.CDS01 [Cosmosporella sp. VM-42]
MNGDRSTPPTAASTVASVSTQHSNRATPYPPSTSAAATTPALTASPIVNHPPASTAAEEVMATPVFLPPAHAFPSHMGFPSQNLPYFSMTTTQPFDREGSRAIGTRFAQPSPPIASVHIRYLPLGTSLDSLRILLVWSTELIDTELLPVEESDDDGFLTAVCRFQTMTGALEAKRLLDGRLIDDDAAEMVVEIQPSSPLSARRQPGEPSANLTNGISSAMPSAPGSRQPPRFNGAFQSLENISPPTNGGYLPSHELPVPDASAHYQALFSPQSPIGNHVTEINRVSGKSLIANDSPDDDETTNLLKDPVAYAENGATGQRRATAPQIPINRMAGLSLNTNNPPAPGPSSLPQYGHMSAQSGPLSPLSSSGSGMPYNLPAQPYQRHNFPPVNPADQNPPCNTLYVGNLPLDTSEEELKAMFAKQRGYKRLCFRTKQNGPMCFVEFEDISFATKALHELYGHPLHNSVKGGIRLSFSKNPLGVRSGQAPGQSNSGALGGMNGIMSGPPNGFTTANGPPPGLGLSAPPGLGTGRGNYHGPPVPNGHSYTNPSFSNAGWNGTIYSGQVASPAGISPNGIPLNGLLSNGLPPNGLGPNGLSPNGGGKNIPGNGFPPHMMGR